ncbi:MAG: hypothetical protein ACLFPQ_02070 [Candidatus Woesearchaeota archaeon]
MNTGAKIFLIVGIAMGVFMAIYIGTSLVSIYNNSKDTVEKESEDQDIDCMQMFFEAYLENDNTLIISNSRISSFQIKSIFIRFGDGNDSLREHAFPRFAPGEEKEIDISEIPVENEFDIYPFGCEVHTKSCDISTGICE